jgi:hypothetical protein
MQVFHTAGVPPRRGRIIFPIMGCTRNNSVALLNSVNAYAANMLIWKGDKVFLLAKKV